MVDDLVAIGILAWFTAFLFLVWVDLTELCARAVEDEGGSDG